MRTSNPTLNDKVFQRELPVPGQATMTINGAVNKTLLLVTLLIISAGGAWKLTAVHPALSLPFLVGGAILGLIVVVVSSFKPMWSPILAPTYALVEGGFVGVISLRYATMFDGIVVQAAMITVGVLLALLFAYQSRLIKVTENFKLGVVAATGGIFLVYMASWVLSMFGVGVPFIHEGGMLGIGFSVFVVVIAALNLVLDFDFIENGAAAGAPKYMEWQAGLGLLVTLVWLYIEVLRLLAKLRSSD